MFTFTSSVLGVLGGVHPRNTVVETIVRTTNNFNFFIILLNLLLINSTKLQIKYLNDKIFKKIVTLFPLIIKFNLIMDKQVLIAFGLTLFAGISTGIGSAIAFFAKRTNTYFLSVSLGFSAGVMTYVSFVELMPNAVNALSFIHGAKAGTIYATLAFFGGILLIMLIDKLVPKKENPHEMRKVEDMGNINVVNSVVDKSGLIRVGLVTALIIAVHNFPEGMVTFIAAIKDVKIAIPIAIAIAIHNIPEGISVSVPVYYATGNRRKAFWLSFLSGMAEPLGALVGYLLIAPFLTDTVLGVIFGMIAGIMVFISFDELLPAAEEYGQHHSAIYGLVAGMAVMAVSLIVLT